MKHLGFNTRIWGVIVITIVITLFTVKALTTDITSSYSGSMKVLRERGTVVVNEHSLTFHPNSLGEGAYTPSILELEALAKLGEVHEGLIIMY